MKLMTLVMTAASAALLPVAQAEIADPAPAHEALAQVAEKNSEDLFPVVEAVLNAGGSPEDFEPFMRAAAKASAPAAQLWVAQTELEKLVAKGGDAVAADEVVSAVKALDAAAKAGYVPALLVQSHMAGAGIGRRPSEKEGQRLLAEACKAGSTRARAAYLLVSGRLNAGDWTVPEVASELEKNNFYLEEIIASLYGADEQARTWYEKAAEHGSARAAYVLSQTYEDAIPEDRAAEYLKLAAERHLPEALAAVGMLEVNGDGKLFPVNREQGMRKLQSALMLGYQPVAVTLASLYMNEPDKHSAESILALYKNAAEQGDGRAMVAYAYCIATGRGCEADAAKGREMLKTLAFNGMPYASMALADLYFNGVGEAADVRAAVNALGEAASAGVPQCYTLMAALTALGTETTKGDERRAESFLRMAEENHEQNPREMYQSLLADKGWHFLPPAQEREESSDK